MKLSRDEEAFLRHWIYDEAHFRSGVGPAKRLHEHRIVPADLAILVAAVLPDPSEQERAASAPVATAEPRWPWEGDALRERLAEARATLAAR
jgi:hypothetical protein